MTKFTIQELTLILQLLDLATKAGGLQTAQQALPLIPKLQQMARELENPECFAEAAE